ncbi:hypothetical protein [Psychroserpens mesophilus]|uniref:hypothetical protein n=1 Tax=Psychroserpens mesophilus TaxID=325473 RepID=UPI003D65F51A
MTVFESLNRTTDKATEKAEKYIKTSQEYFRLKVFQQITLSLSLILKLVIIGGLAMLSIVFIAVSAAIAIGEALGNMPVGYLIVGGIFLTIAVIAYFIRHLIDKKIITSISDKFFD